jgi:hypothetical protein
MTKTQRIFDALAAMGRPATAKELSEATGISQASVSAVICDRMKYSTSQFSAETFFRDGGGITPHGADRDTLAPGGDRASRG